MKVLREPTVNLSRKVKLSYGTYNSVFSVDPKETLNAMPLHYYWFAKIITEKMLLRGCDLNNPFVPERTKTNVNVKEQLIDGILFKRSQYLGNWELRYVAITPNGLFSFKNETSGESFSIRKGTTTELWTRFEIHQMMFVIKVHHLNRKT